MNLEAGGEYIIKVENKGSEALETMRQFKPDMVFLDIIMPDVDGAQIMKNMKEDEELKNIPIVFLTALLKENEIQNTFSKHKFLSKPVTTEEVIGYIKETLG